MNRIFSQQQPAGGALRRNLDPMQKPSLRLRHEANSFLRELAYVLHLTRQVKAELNQDRESAELAAV